MTIHSKEPWSYFRNSAFVEISSEEHGEIGNTCASSCFGNEDLGDANARRIVACVNACKGLDTEDLERNGVIAASSDYFSKLKWQRDELLAALQGMIDIASDSQGVAGYHLNGEVADWDEFEEWQAACDAIAKAKGGAA